MPAGSVVGANEPFPTAPVQTAANSPAVSTVAPASRETDAVVGTSAVEEPKKKRGFWSRVFGRGKDDKKDERKKAND